MELKDLENIVIHCLNTEEAKECCDLADRLGLKWGSGLSYREEIHWKSYKENTCYDFCGGEYAPKEFMEENGYTIKPASWFLENFKIQDMETKEKNGSIAEMYACANDELKKVLEGKFTKEELGIKEEFPNTWGEFCEQNPIRVGECYFDSSQPSPIIEIVGLAPRDINKCKNVTVSEVSAKAHLALMQLEQLRDKYRQGWKPDWSDCSHKYTIFCNSNKIDSGWINNINSFLSFQSEELRDKFLKNFKDLIEIAKDLI